MAEGAEVLVVGAGPTGLTLACELARHGVACRLVEQLVEPTVWSRAAVAHARTLEMWDAMGVAEEALARTRVVRGTNVFSAQRRIAHLSLDGLDSPYPHVYGISQRDIEAVLAAHFERLGGTVERGVELEGFAQDGEGITATLRRADGRREQARSRWLVGCDGAHSRVRKVLGFPFEGGPYEEKLVQADVRVELPLLGMDDEILLFLGHGEGVALFPLFQDGRYRLVILGAECEGEPTLELFQEALAANVPGARVSDPAWMVAFRIHHRRCERYRSGRAFLAGDAGHIHSPVGGQGANTGMQDAFNLAWKLALVTRGVGAPSLLDSYEPERLPIARALVDNTDAAMRRILSATQLANPIVRALRDQLVQLASKLSVVQLRALQAVSMLEHHYRESPLSRQDRAPMWRTHVVGSDGSEAPSLADWAAFGDGPAPGDRAPDAVARSGAGVRRVHELLRAPRFQLLLFDGAAATQAGYENLTAIARRVRERAGDEIATHVVVPREERPAALGAGLDVIQDADGAVHRRYGARSECLYLLRPDGYVAYRNQPADADRLLAYLDHLFLRRTA